MRYALRVFIVFVLCFAPASTVLAQDFDDIPAVCDPAYWLDVYAVQLFSVQDFTQLADLIGSAFTTALDCGDDWLTLAIDLIFGTNVLPAATTTNGLDPEDGILTPAEAEFALENIFIDMTVANQYFCEAEQFDESDLEGLEEFGDIADFLTIDATCADNTLGMECAITMTMNFEGVEDTFTESATFAVQDGKLCTEVMGDF